MSELPRICVLIPVWKDQAGLDRTLLALADEVEPFDIVVVDDGSPEPITCEPSSGGHAVTLKRLPRNQGIANALNAGLEIILDRGYRYVARLDGGDIAFPQRLSRQADFLDAHPEVGVVGTWAECVDDDGAYLFTMRFPAEHEEMLRKQRYVPALLHPTIMVRTETFRLVGPYSDRYKSAEDYDLFVRLSRVSRLANLPEVMTRYIVSPSGATASKRRQNLIERARIQAANFGWTDVHAYIGLARTILFLPIPFDWLVAAKRRLWR
jgi:glycosyltransferase involved in cell wall biosynthesis